MGLRWRALWSPLALWFLASIAFVVFSCSARRRSPTQRRQGDVGSMFPADDHGSRRTHDSRRSSGHAQEAFTRFTQPLNKGYAHEVYWLRVEVPMPPPGDSLQEGASWLEILPTYLDKVTLYQLAGGVWHEQSSGDTVPMAERIRARVSWCCHCCRVGPSFFVCRPRARCSWTPPCGAPQD